MIRSFVLFTFFIFVIPLLPAQSSLKNWEGLWKGKMTAENFISPPSEVDVMLEIVPMGENRWSWKTTYSENIQLGIPAVIKDYQMVMIDSTRTPFHLEEDDGFIIYFSWVQNQLIGSFLIDSEEGTFAYHAQYEMNDPQELIFTLTGHRLPEEKRVFGEMQPIFIQTTRFTSVKEWNKKN
jgi:hypothetical protein